MMEKTWELSVKDDMPHAITEYVEEELDKELADEEKTMIMKFNIAIDELCSNVLFYSEASTIFATLQVDETCVSLQFKDNGVPYDIMETEDPDLDAALDEDSVGGYGIFMVKNLMDVVEYSYTDNQNIVTIKKNR